MICKKFLQPVLFAILAASFVDGACVAMGSGNFVYDKSTSKLLGKVQLIGKLESVIKAQEDRLVGITDPDEKKNAEMFLGLLKGRYTMLLKPISTGKIIAGAMIDEKSHDLLDEAQIDSIMDGVVSGLVIRSASAVGKVFSTKVEGTLNTVLGGAWDFTFSKLIDSWSQATNIVFHNSKEPFTVENLQAWQTMIEKVFKNVELMLSKGMQQSMRGTDTTLRSFNPTATPPGGAPEDKKESEAVETEKVVNDTLWYFLISGYSRLFDRFIVEIESRKGYYKATSMETFYAGMIQRSLCEFKIVLAKADTLSALNNLIESNKTLVSSYSDYVNRLFAGLEDLVRPRSYSLQKTKTPNTSLNTTRRVGRHLSGDDYYDDHNSFSH